MLKLSSGDYFGEIALLSGKPRQASVKAVGHVTVLVMSRDAFTRLCGNLFGKSISPPDKPRIFVGVECQPSCSYSRRPDICLCWLCLVVLAEILKRNMSKYSDMELPADEPEPVEEDAAEVMTPTHVVSRSTSNTLLLRLAAFSSSSVLSPQLRSFLICSLLILNLQQEQEAMEQQEEEEAPPPAVVGSRPQRRRQNVFVEVCCAREAALLLASTNIFTKR